MSTVVAAISQPRRLAAGSVLIGGVMLAASTEAIAGTVLALGRAHIMGDASATPDEIAWLDTGYIAAKLSAFLAASWFVIRFDPRALLLGATLVMGVACAIAAATMRLELLIGMRVVQGFAGGLILVGGQVLLFLVFMPSRQPVVQALFATAAVVAPATLAPALQGWLIDSGSWAWIFFAVVPVALAAAGLLLMADAAVPRQAGPASFDWIGFSLVGVAAACITHVLGQGQRWDWFAEPRILWTSLAGVAALIAFLLHQRLSAALSLVDFSTFRCADFTFAFIVSFVAGAALFGSGFLIPAFASAILAMTPTEAGLLLLPSGLLFAVTLFGAAGLMARGLPPVATVPFGILLIMIAMWMLSGSVRDSGVGDMMPAVLLRGVGLGLLFLSITLIAFGRLAAHTLASGIGLFNAGRQLGGLLGVAALQTMIDHDLAANLTIIGGHVTAGTAAVGERLTASTAMLATAGMDAAMAPRAATALLGRSIASQAGVIAFDHAFRAVAMLFVFAAPLLVAIRIMLSRRAAASASKIMSQ